MQELFVLEQHPCVCYLGKGKQRNCSHVALQITEAGKPLFSDLNCLRQAAELLGLEIVQQNTYHWFGRHVGDYPLPAGMKASELGKNALFVLRANSTKAVELERKYRQKPYEIGVVADPNNPGCYTVIYDFYNRGYGIEDLVGSPVRNRDGDIQLLCPQLKQVYDIVCESQSAKEVGDVIEILRIQEAREKYPQYFADIPRQEDEANTWTSIAFTEERIGVR